jgi:photosystem II stability/assembly factor-like uncharacterized protein
MFATTGNSGRIYKSANFGTTWNDVSASINNWSSITCSRNGLIAFAVTDSGTQPTGLRTTNGGTTWTNYNVGTSAWNSVSGTTTLSNVYICGSGRNVMKGQTGGETLTTPTETDNIICGCSYGNTSDSIFISNSNSKIYKCNGSAFLSLSSPPSLNWSFICCSEEWQIIAAVATNSGSIYTSANTGTSWITRTTGLPTEPQNWSAICCSSNGTRLAATINGGTAIYISTDSGNTWIKSTFGLPTEPQNWSSICMTPDGKKLAAVIYGGSAIYTLDLP